MATCSIDDCETTASARGWCKKHYSRWFRYGDANFRKTKQQSGVCVVGDCDRPQKTNNMCHAHQQRSRRGDVRADVPLRSVYEHTRVETEQGYVRIKTPGHPRGGKHSWVLEHIVVMEGELRRELLPGENVHHVNGIRNDNRPENLELWVTTQPAGQRAIDVLRWAEEIVQRYGSERDALERPAL